LERYGGEAFALGHLLLHFPILALTYLEFLLHRLEWTVANGRWRCHRVPVGRRHLFVLAYAIRGKCIWMRFKFEGPTYIDYACLQGCLPRHVQRGRQRYLCRDPIHRVVELIVVLLG
jgi:hypothetical protein